MTFIAENPGHPSFERLRKEWGWIALRGFCALTFGVLALVLPGVTLAFLVIVWGAYALADGVLALIAGLRLRDNGRPLWSLIIVGMLGIVAGVVTSASGPLPSVCFRSSRPCGCDSTSEANGCTHCQVCCRSSLGSPSCCGPAPAPSRWHG